MAITTREQLAAAMSGAFVYHYSKNVSANLSSVIRASGFHQSGLPAATTQLTLPPLTPGNTWYLAEFQASGTNSLQACGLFDRYSSSSGVVGDPAANWAVTVALPARVTNQTSGHQIWIETVNSISSTPSVTVSYTNSSGVAGRTGTLQQGIQTTASNGTMLGPVMLQAGDLGVRSVESINIPASTGQTGVMFVVLAKLMAVATVDSTTREPTRSGWAETGLVDLGTDPRPYVAAMGTGTGFISAVLTFVQG